MGACWEFFNGSVRWPTLYFNHYGIGPTQCCSNDVITDVIKLLWRLMSAYDNLPQYTVTILTNIQVSLCSDQRQRVQAKLHLNTLCSPTYGGSLAHCELILQTQTISLCFHPFYCSFLGHYQEWFSCSIVLTCSPTMQILSPLPCLNAQFLFSCCQQYLKTCMGLCLSYCPCPYYCPKGPLTLKQIHSRDDK